MRRLLTYDFGAHVKAQVAAMEPLPRIEPATREKTAKTDESSMRQREGKAAKRARHDDAMTED